MTEALQAAITAATQFPLAEPVPAVAYRSAGRLLIIGARERVLPLVSAFPENIRVDLLLTDAGADEKYSGKLLALAGWLGEFDARWLDTDGKELSARFDLVLDLAEPGYFKMHQPPQGYWAPIGDAQLDEAIAEIGDAVGEFEKPKFFLLDEKICAHSRSRQEGCNRCVEVCSTEAVSPAGDSVRVEPHLCMGCGACATVCPSGAMRYNYPSMSYWGSKLKAMLHAYRAAGGTDACLLVHEENQVLQADLMPERVIPVPVFHVASIGLDWLLGALAMGANQIMILRSGKEAPQYVEALQNQIVLGEEILHGLGYGKGHFGLVDSFAELIEIQPASVPAEEARFGWFDEKRTTLEFCIEHFMQHAPNRPEVLALPQSAPFGMVDVNGERCTLCYSCVAICPASALQDGSGRPQLDFIERNCVQCGLCENACPEDAISLTPRLLLTPQAKQKRMLHADQPFHCVRCGKPFGTRSMVLGMTAKLSGHSMFSSPEALNRLKMCGDCRVIDAMVVQA